MQPIRVCTYDGPGAQPVLRSVPWPKIPNKAALIKVGACGVCGTDLHILKGIGRSHCHGHSRSVTKSAVCWSKSARISRKTS